MSESERNYDLEFYSLGSLELEPFPDDDLESAVDIPVKPRIRPLNYSLDVIHRLIEKLQDL